MNDFPTIVGAAKQERLVTPIVDNPAIALHRCLHLDVGNCPGKIAFNVSFNLGKFQLEAIQGVALWFHVVFHEILQTSVLAARLDETRTILAEEVAVERRAIRILPTVLDGGDDLLQLIVYVAPVRSGGDGYGHPSQ